METGAIHQEETMARKPLLPKKYTGRPEHVVCCQLVDWIRENKYNFVFVRIPNDGLGKAASVKVKGALTGEGWERGYPDYWFCEAQGGYSGLVLEVKAADKDGGGFPREGDYQYNFLTRCGNSGLLAVSAKGIDACKTVLKSYFFMDGKLQPQESIRLYGGIYSAVYHAN